jgi:hypothetical protein
MGVALLLPFTGERALGQATYVVEAVYVSGGCMDIENGSTASGDNAKVEPCDQGTSQQWTFEHTSNGYYLVKAGHTGMCLDVKGASTQKGRNVQQYPCHGGANQQWKPVSVDPTNLANKTYWLQNLNSGYCLAAVLPGTLFKQAHILEQNSCATAWNHNCWVLEDQFCGNGHCGFGESCSSCAQDCGPCPAACGNGLCESGESCLSCFTDCGPCSACGNGICEFGESCTTCATDCGSCPNPNCPLDPDCNYQFDLQTGCCVPNNPTPGAFCLQICN